MALHFILGGSGSGKSTWLFQNIIRQSLEHPERQYLVIVPEQSTLLTTREIIMQHPAKGILNIDVLSFHRLSYRVFEQTGTGTAPVLTETGKNLLLRKAAARIRSDLPWLGAKLDRQGYVTQARSVLSELAQYEVTPQILRTLSEEQTRAPFLSRKIDDIARLQEAFEQEKEGLFITAEEIPALLAAHAHESPLLKDCVLAFDGFTGFTPVQMTAIRALLRCAGEVYVTMTVDPDEDIFGAVMDHELFAMSKRMIQSLAGMASREGIPIAEPVRIDPSRGRHRPGSDLWRLERCLMRDSKSSPGAGAADKAGAGQVIIRKMPDPAREAAFAAATVLSLVHEEGYALRDVGVVCSDMEIYAEHLSRAFDRVGIPHFIDRKQPVLMNPCLEFVRAALEAADKKFSYVSAMRLLRTGFAGLTGEETDLLENYLLAAGVRSWNGWKRPWVRPVSCIDSEELIRVNEMRKAIALKMEPFMKVFSEKEGTVKVYAQALEELLERFAVREKLLDPSFRPRSLSESAYERKAREYDHVYESLLQVLGEAKMLLGEGRIAREEFAGIMEAGFEQAQIGMLPARYDQVYIGDLMRSRIGNVKAMIILGMNEGLVPAKNASAGLFTPMDRQILDECGIRLSPSMREDAYIQRYYIYLNFTRPSEKLFLSCSGYDSAGGQIAPSALIREVERILPHAGLHTPGKAAAPGSAHQLFTMDDVAMSASLRLGSGRTPEGDPYLALMMDALEKSGKESALRAALAGRSLCCSGEQISPLSAAALYGEAFSGSVSRMDTFARCPFEHFLTYGLRLKEREEFSVRAIDTGTLFHAALESFGALMSPGRPYDWRSISDEQAGELTGKCVEEAALSLFNGLFSDTERNRYAMRRVSDILRASVWGMLRQVRAGDLTPTFFETAFRENGIRGKIDRIDVCEQDGRIYMSVLDYKSGLTPFDLERIYDGRTLQLPVYLGRAMQFLEKKYPGREIVPAGIFYQHLVQPEYKALPSLILSPSDLEQKLLRALRPEGIVNPDPGAMRAFAGDDTVRSLIIPAPKYNKDGSVSKNSPLSARTEQMKAIASFADRKMDSMREHIGRGEIRTQPYREKNVTACENCAYRSACMFDMRLPGARVRYKTKLDPEQILDIMSRM